MQSRYGTFLGFANEFSSLTFAEVRTVCVPEVSSKLGSNPSINIFKLTVLLPKFTA
ncbi:hypothetical protein Hanom_Chr13g01204651 [Helianthus anomalus]